ncbi:ABC transporter ATP-binding protein [Cellulomonas soli]
MRLVAENLTFGYPGHGPQVLRGVDLEVPPGTSTAIVGPSGSGKTTLLSVIGGLLRPSAGRARAVDSAGSTHRVDSVATWVLQTVSLLPERTAADNVMVGAYSDTDDRTEADRRTARSLAAVGLGDRAGARARLLSGGEAQRVAIARALASHRPVLLADEPTGQLDAATSAAVADALLGATGRTVVVVTHDLEVAARCTQVLELRDGRIHSEGDR